MSATTMTNEEVVERFIDKAVITTSDLATGGKLNDEQTEQFIDFVVDVTELKGNVRVVRFRQESMEINKIGVGSRVTVPKDEAMAPQVRAGITTGKVTITPKNLMTPYEVSDDFKDQCIEGEAVEDTVTRLMATATGNDIEELLINGDALGPARYQSELPGGGSTTQVVKDTFIGLFNGWLRLADAGNVWDGEGNDISTVAFSRMIQKMPNKFRRLRRNLRFLSSLDHEQLYREKVGARQTAAGDAANQSDAPLKPYGIPLVPVPLLDSEPRVVEHFTVGAAPAVADLNYGPIGTDIFVTLQTLAQTPTTPYVEDTDYTVNRVLGTVTTTIAPGALAAGANIKVTYHARGMMLLADYQNLIMAIGRDIRIESQRDIHRSVTQFAITTRVGANVEEATAIVKGINIGLE